jgi:hypothetical protein
MKTQEQIARIESNNSAPFQMFDFISSDENQMLLDFFNNSDKEIKSTGPTVVRPDLNLPVFKNIFERVQDTLGDVNLESALIFSTPWAHVIHNDDDTRGEDLPYKAITIPLYINNGVVDTDVKLMMFDQYYYHGGRKFMNGGVPKVNQFANNGPLLEYSEVSYTNDNGIDNAIKEHYLSHCQPNWLEGLSIHSYFPWKINSAIVFDSCRLHSSSDFNALGATQKIALSIFTYI